MNIQLLDCTLRDGAYIVDGNFGSEAIHGIIKRLTEANVDIIECGWLKDSEYKGGSTYFNTVRDIETFICKKNKNTLYVAMIDWDRYDVSKLTEYDGYSIDAIRVVFPRGKCKCAISVGEAIRKRGYKVFFQIANTLGYSDQELLDVINEMNKFKPDGLSIVDTFGAMYSEDIYRIISLVDHNLNKEIDLGFHSHNNLQQSFSLSMEFVKILATSNRNIFIDSSLSGMGRGAGNAPTELVAGFLNKFYKKAYNMDIIIDIIDVYISYFQKSFNWGYSTPFFLSGTYCSHVNNIAYLVQKHKTKNKDMKQILEKLPPDKRLVYDYDLLEKVYVDYHSNEINDDDNIELLSKLLEKHNVVVIAPGKNSIIEKQMVENVVNCKEAVVIGVNAIVPGYKYDYLFFSNFVRLEYALESNYESFNNVKVILTSNLMKNIEDVSLKDMEVYYINYNNLIRRDWIYFDNSMIMCLRLLANLGIENIDVAGFDGYSSEDSKNYVARALELTSGRESSEVLNREIGEMLVDVCNSNNIKINFITHSIFESIV